MHTLIIAALIAAGSEAEFPSGSVRTVEFGELAAQLAEEPAEREVRRPEPPRVTAPAPPRVEPPRVAAPRVVPREAVVTPTPQPIVEPTPVKHPTPNSQLPTPPSTDLKIPDLAMSSPEAIAPLDGTSAPNEEAVAEEFISRRESLGQPTDVVPPIDPLPVPEPRSESRIGNWYKTAAGALFLAALAFIGIRSKPRQRAESLDYSASWLPPRKADNALLMKSARGLKGPYANDFIDDRAEPGFHDEIERRVRKLAVKNETRPTRRSSLREEEYSMIAQLASEGMNTRQISRKLGIPAGEIQTVIGVRSRRSSGASGNIPIEIR